MKPIRFKTRWGTEETCYLVVDKYTHGDNVCLRLVDEDGCPYAFLTVNFEGHREGLAYLDVNNFPESVEIFERYELGDPADSWLQSGWVTYPLYMLNMDRINEYKIA